MFYEMTLQMYMTTWRLSLWLNDLHSRQCVVPLQIGIVSLDDSEVWKGGGCWFEYYFISSRCVGLNRLYLERSCILHLQWSKYRIQYYKSNLLMFSLLISRSRFVVAETLSIKCQSTFNILCLLCTYSLCTVHLWQTRLTKQKKEHLFYE